MDVICQAKSGMGKTAVFVIATLQQLEPEDGRAPALVLCHTRELAYQVGGGWWRWVVVGWIYILIDLRTSVRSAF